MAKRRSTKGSPMSFPVLQAIILHADLSPRSHTNTLKLLPLVPLLPLKISPFYLVDPCIRQQPYNIFFRNKDQLLLCKTSKASFYLRDSENKVTAITFYPALPKVIILLTLYVHIIKIIHLCYSELL